MKFIKIHLVLLFCIILSTNISAKDRVYKLKLATSWGPTATPLIDAAKNMAKYANEMSKGRLVITVDASNKHKAPFGVFDMVKGGQYDMGHTTSYFWKGKDINTLPFTTMPFGLTAPEQYAWFYYGGGLELMQKVYKKHKMLSFPGGNTGVQMGGWFRKEIKGIEDLKGLRMRIPGFAGEIMAKLGVLVTNIAPAELYTSLERGNLDALEWVGPSMDISMGFHKVAPYYYTGWHEPAAETQFLVNIKKFKKLPKDLREILRVAMKTAAYDMYIQNYHLSALAWDKMRKEYPNIKVKSLPKSVMKSLKETNDELLEKISKDKPLLQQTLQSQKEYLIKARAWTEMSDYLYLKDNIK